jgi:lysophospholipase L1-like esterase
MTQPRELVLLLLVAVAASCGGATTPSNPAPVEALPPAQQGCARTSVGFTPLSDSGSYQGQSTGLYGSGSNLPPAAHAAAGVNIARSIGPLDAQGRPSTAGRFAFISIGMSNTTQEFSAFKPMGDSDSSRHPQLTIVDGAQGGMTAADWASPQCSCWAVLDQRLAAAGLAAPQVAVAWVKLADRQPSEAWPAHAMRLRDEIVTVVRRLNSRFPNLRLAYLSSRIYAGYATTTLNPEPYAYESGFAVRWVIEEQLKGALEFDGAGAVAPWVGWGPYLWADGMRGRSDGLTWACSDFQSDGTHPSPNGRQKVAARLLEFVRTDPTAREWYLTRP